MVVESGCWNALPSVQMFLQIYMELVLGSVFPEKRLREPFGLNVKRDEYVVFVFYDAVQAKYAEVCQ